MHHFLHRKTHGSERLSNMFAGRGILLFFTLHAEGLADHVEFLVAGRKKFDRSILHFVQLFTRHGRGADVGLHGVLGVFTVLAHFREFLRIRKAVDHLVDRRVVAL